MSTAVLLADREPATRTLLERHLRHDGFELVAGSGRAPDLVLAGDDADLERWKGEVPVIVLGRAEAEPVERVRAFRRGCDDYVSQPFQYDELVERIRAVLRRVHPPEEGVIAAGPLRIDLYARAVRIAGTAIPLSQKEFALVVRLGSDPHRVFTKEELLREIWGYHAGARTRALDSHVSRLRRKFKQVDPTALLLENVWGVGYRLLPIHHA